MSAHRLTTQPAPPCHGRSRQMVRVRPFAARQLMGIPLVPAPLRRVLGTKSSNMPFFAGVEGTAPELLRRAGLGNQIVKHAPFPQIRPISPASYRLTLPIVEIPPLNIELSCA